jgi:pimeloyl-ACP methyl ester carboxylesterase
MSMVFKSEKAKSEVLDRYRDVLDKWPIANTRLRLPTRQGETFVISCGNPGAKPLILLHGSQANAAAWMFDAAVWSEHFHVHAVDVIGEPGLSAASRPRFDSEAYAQWLDDVMDGLNLKAASFVGVSLGGWLALDYAIRRPHRVAQLALLCPAGVGRQKNFLLKAAPLLLLGPWGLRKVREMVLGRLPTDLPPPARSLVELMSLIGRSVRTRTIRIPLFGDAVLGALTMPLLVILGGRDVLLDSCETKSRLERLTPECRDHFLPEARHFIPGQTERIQESLLRNGGG